MKQTIAMALAFNKILIPVDFSLSTATAVQKAIGYIEKEEGTIHLLHVIKPRVSASHLIIKDVERNMQLLREQIAQRLTGIAVKEHIIKGVSVQNTIIEMAAVLSPDLIIIGKQGKRKRWAFFRGSISPGHIARKSNCPVLTAKPGSLESRTRIIVLPVRNFVPQRKLDLAILIARKCRAQVHLLAIQDSSRRQESLLPQPFIKAYHQLRETLNHPVEYFPIFRNNTARATLDYAQFVMADIILLNPETESGTSSFVFSRHISDLIKKDSKLQILDVSPY